MTLSERCQARGLMLIKYGGSFALKMDGISTMRLLVDADEVLQVLGETPIGQESAIFTVSLTLTPKP